MKLYPKIIPAIARDVVGTLMAEGDVEVETMRVADAEMDMAAILKEYLASEERVNQATREALERRGYDHSRFNQVKREMADVRGFKMGDEGIDYIINQMIEFLLISRNDRQDVSGQGNPPRKTRRAGRIPAASLRHKSQRRKTGRARACGAHRDAAAAARFSSSARGSPSPDAGRD